MTDRFAILRSTFAFAVAAGATLLIVAGSAAPVSAAQAPSIAIDTHGIDLASAAGVARVEAEIGRAARSVCSVAEQNAPAAATARKKCIQTALATARPQLDALAATARNARLAVAEAATTAEQRR